MVIGVRFTVEKDILYVQIKEGKLLPFGQTIPNKDWTPVKQNLPLNETAPVILGCKFLLARQWVPPDQVLIGVRLEDFDRKGKCTVTVVVHGRKADLLEGQLLDYRSNYFATR